MKAGLAKLQDKYFTILNEPFTKMEIENAVLQLDGHQTRGPDGTPVIFFQHFWHIVGDDLIQMVATFLNRCFLLKEINQTIITLIPKGEEQCSFIDFRPISLCNVAYKVISKTLTNRLQGILEDIITPFKNAFSKGRNIYDNILVAHEVLIYIKRKKKERVFGLV